jgi:hypothetical protein
MKHATPTEQLKKVMKVSSVISVLFHIFAAFAGIGVATSLIALASSDSFQLTLGNGEWAAAFNAQQPDQQISLHISTAEKDWGPSFQWNREVVESSDLSLALTTPLRIVTGVLMLLKSAIILFLLEQLARLFQLYAKGEIFTSLVVQRIRNTGITLLCFPTLELVNSLAASVVVAQAKPGAFWLDFHVGSSAIHAGVVVLLISWIMDVGRAQREENELTI